MSPRKHRGGVPPKLAKAVTRPLTAKRKRSSAYLTNKLTGTIRKSMLNNSDSVPAPNSKRQRKSKNIDFQAAWPGDAASSNTAHSLPFEGKLQPLPSTEEKSSDIDFISETQDKKQDSDAEFSLEEALLEVSALLLASVDKRAYKRALLCDANVLLNKIVLPMGFPWSQAKEERLVQVTARDIDEMDGLAFTDDCEESASLPLLKRTGRSSFVRRASDPGVLECETIAKPSLVRQLSQLPCLDPTVPQDDHSPPGELFLQMHHQSEVERHRVKIFRGGLRHRTFVSLNFASTSSRSTILTNGGQDCQPLILQALLPSEIQQGTRTTRVLANGIAEQCGTYDCRYGRSKESEDAKRCRAGRTRKVWTKKLPSSATVLSMLTGEQFQAALWRRPRDVKVGIRVNGFLLSTESTPSTMKEDIIQDHDRIDEDANYLKSPTSMQRLQWRLDLDSFVGEWLGSEKLDPLKCSVDLENKPYVVSILPPTLICLPAEGGLLYTMCSAAGEVAVESANKISTSSTLDAIARKKRLCVICWDSVATNAQGDDISLKECTRCGMLVHSLCYGASLVSTQEWKCDACLFHSSQRALVDSDKSSFRRYRLDLACYMCGKKGSSLLRHERGFIHNVCRDLTPLVSEQSSQACALCGTFTGAMIRCVAKNCLVEFHALCALELSNFADAHYIAEDAYYRETDKFVCTQFRLARLDVVSRASDALETIMVGFCGLHNPDRRGDFAGLPDGGASIEASMHVPLISEKNETVGNNSSHR